MRASKPAAKAKRKSVTQKRLSPSARSPVSARTDTSEKRTTNDQRGTSKKATIEALVRRSEGAAIAELMAATGWQEHSIRAALTGLRKAGYVIARERLTIARRATASPRWSDMARSQNELEQLVGLPAHQLRSNGGALPQRAAEWAKPGSAASGSHLQDAGASSMAV